MGKRRHTLPDNAGVAVVPTFAADPYGLALFAGALEQSTTGLSQGMRPVIDARGSGRWQGWSPGVQTLQTDQTRGAAGTGRAVVPPTTRLDQTSGSAASTPLQQIFQDRMAARRFS